MAKVGIRAILGYFQEHQVPLDVEHAYWMRYPTALFTGYLKFAFVRHPVGRMYRKDFQVFGYDPAQPR